MITPKTSLTHHDVPDIHDQFHAMDVRGQIIHNRRVVLDELMASLRADFEAERYSAVLIHYRIFLHHAVNALLLHTIPDSKILAGQDTPSGSDTEKVQQYLGDPTDPNPVSKELCDALSKTVHATKPPPEESQPPAIALFRVAELLYAEVVRIDVGLNKWWEDAKADGIIPNRYEVKPKKRKRNP
jgi:hypothetical protein